MGNNIKISIFCFAMFFLSIPLVVFGWQDAYVTGNSGSWTENCTWYHAYDCVDCAAGVHSVGWGECNNKCPGRCFWHASVYYNTCGGEWCSNAGGTLPSGWTRAHSYDNRVCHYISEVKQWSECSNYSQSATEVKWSTVSGTSCSNVALTRYCEPPFQDIGLRVREGENTRSIAIENDCSGSNKPLRIAKNGITYCVALVDCSDSWATKVKIKTSGGIRCWRKL